MGLTDSRTILRTTRRLNLAEIVLGPVILPAAYASQTMKACTRIVLGAFFANAKEVGLFGDDSDSSYGSIVAP